MYNKPKLQSITAPVSASISCGVLSPPRSYTHPLKHRNQASSTPNSAVPTSSQKENVTTNFVFREEEQRKIRRTKQQQIEDSRHVVSPESPSRTTHNRPHQSPTGKQPRQQPQKDTAVPPLLQVVKSDRPTTLLAKERSTSWSSAGETTSISSLSNSFDRQINNSNRLKQQRDQLTSAMTAILPYVDCYQSLAKLSSPTAAISATPPVHHQKKPNGENFVKSPASAAVTSRSISWWDEPESGESGTSLEANDHCTAAKNGKMKERSLSFNKKGNVSSDLSPTSFHHSTTTSRGITKVSDDCSESETDRMEEDLNINEYKVSSTPLSPSSMASRQSRKDVKPARLIIEKDESIVDVICNATSRIFQQLCAA